MDEAALIGFSRELSRVLGGWVACMALERGILELGCAVADENDGVKYRIGWLYSDYSDYSVYSVLHLEFHFHF